MHRLSFYLIPAAATAVLGGSLKRDVSQRAASARYCASESICYAEFTTPSADVVYRVAIPDSSEAPFDILLQIEAPASVGWAGIAWGGRMTRNPLTISWANGDGAVVSSRWATGHVLPGAYSGASYELLTASSNSSHWSLSVLCTGCSQWDGGELGSTGVNQLAWAMSNNAVTTPADNTSSFGYHSARSTFSLDFSDARIPTNDFRRFVRSLSESEGGEQSSSVTISGPTSSSNPSTEISTPSSSSNTTTARSSTTRVRNTSKPVFTSVTVDPPPKASASTTIRGPFPLKSSTTSTASKTSTALQVTTPAPSTSGPSTTITQVEPGETTRIFTIPLPIKGKRKGKAKRKGPWRGPPWRGPHD